MVFAGTAPLDARSLRTQERSGPPKAKSTAHAGKSADAVQDAIRQEIASLGQAGNWRGLVAKLKDKHPAVRRQAAFALQRVVPDVKRDAEQNGCVTFVGNELHDPWGNASCSCCGCCCRSWTASPSAAP